VYAIVGPGLSDDAYQDIQALESGVVPLGPSQNMSINLFIGAQIGSQGDQPWIGDLWIAKDFQVTSESVRVSQHWESTSDDKDLENGGA